jgi:hypothetical protein
MAIAKLLDRSKRKDIPIAMVDADAGAGLPMKNQVTPAERSRTAADRYPAFSPRKTPPNHMTMKNGTTIPPAIKPNVLDSEYVWTFSRDLRSPGGVLLGVKFDSPVCCSAAFCRSPPLVMLSLDVQETVMKQSTRRLRSRAFRE